MLADARRQTLDGFGQLFCIPETDWTDHHMFVVELLLPFPLAAGMAWSGGRIL